MRRGSEIRLTLRALSLLLTYPSADLQANVGEIRAALRSERALSSRTLKHLEPLLQRLESEDLLDLQSDYSELFDSSRTLSLHLFEHVHGDSRERGQAMVDLGEHYLEEGFAIEAAELPDFLPLFLEFLSLCEPAKARDWLAQPAHVLAALEERLLERASPYAAIFHALITLARGKPDPEAVAELQEHYRAAKSRTLDQEWEDAPVDFAAPLAQEGSGVIARIRAARRAVSEALKS